MGLCAHLGLMHELHLCWGAGLECCPGMAQLGSHQRETPQSEGPGLAGARPLSSYRNSGNGAGKRGRGSPRSGLCASPVFPGRTQPRQKPAARVGAGAGCVQSFLNTAREFYCILEVPRLL